MYKIIRPVFLVILFSFSVLFSGCASASKVSEKTKNSDAPLWLTAAFKMYPSENYFYAVGQGTDRNIAELEAVRGVAGSYGQNITSFSEASRRMTVAMENGSVASASENMGFCSDVVNNVNHEDLIGIETKEFWFDKKNGIWYALAVIDKKATADLYASMILKNYCEIKNLLNCGADALSLENYAKLDFAEEIALVTEKYFERLYILDWKKAESVQNIDFSSKTVHVMKLEVARQIPIFINIENDVDGQFTAAIGNALTKYGFYSSKDNGGRYSIEGNAVFSEGANTKKTILYTKCILPLYFKDSKEKSIIITVNLERREGSQSYENSKIRAVNAVKKMIASEFPKAFNNYLGNSE